MRSFHLLLVASLALGGCKKISCLFGLNSSDGACTIPAAPSCGDGQLRDATGTCRAVEGFEVDTDPRPPPGDDTDVLVDTDAPVDTNTEQPPDDTDVPAGDCAYTLYLYTDGYPSEMGFRFLDGRTTLLEVAPGSLSNANAEYSWDFVLDRGEHSVVALDTWGDGWGEGYFEVQHDASGSIVSAGTCLAATLTYTFDVTCSAALP